MFYAIVTSDNDFVRECYGTLRLGEKFRNFTELFNVSYGTEQLWLLRGRGQILNFGPDFLETGELWSTYFGICAKALKRPTSHKNFVDQSSKTTKLRIKNRKIYHGG